MDPNASFTITANDETSDGIRSAAKNLRELERPIRDIRLLAQTAFGGFGASFVINKLGSVFDDAAKHAELMGTAEAQSVLEAKKAVDDLTDAFGDLEVEVVSKVSPAIEGIAKFIKQGMSREGRIDSLTAQIGELSKQAAEFEQMKGGVGDNFFTRWLGTDSATELARINEEIKKLVEEREELKQPNPNKALNESMNAFFDSTKNFVVPKGLEDLNKTLDDISKGFAEADRNEQLLDENDLKITVDKTPQLQQMSKFDPEADALAASLANAKKEAKAFADTFAASFESRGIQALLDGDLSGAVKGLAQDFAELIIKLTVLKPLAESIASWLTSSGGLGSLFGIGTGAAAGAGGGAVGGLYTGAESFAGRGPTIQQNFFNQVGLPPQWAVQNAAVGRMAASAAYSAMQAKLAGQR